MQQAMKLNHLSFPSRDVAATADFFTRYLGCTGSAFGSTQILKRVGFDIVIEDASDRDVTWPQNFHIGFELPSLADLQATYRRLVGDGVRMETALITHVRGSRFFCWIPGGIMIEINTRADATEEYRQTFVDN
jgi:catechol 2,3-dioxygenase-like lactoylglutathione lyase family enzyme